MKKSKFIKYVPYSLLIISIYFLGNFAIKNWRKYLQETNKGVSIYYKHHRDQMSSDYPMHKYLATTTTHVTRLSRTIDTINKKPALILFSKKYIKIISDQKNMQNINSNAYYAQGTGFWINDSILVTAEHVISEHDDIKKIIVFGDTLRPKVVSNFRYDESLLLFPKGTADEKYHYKLIPKGYELGDKFGIIKAGYSGIGQIETVIESKAHVLDKNILSDFKKSKWEKYPMALDNSKLGYVIYPIDFYITNNYTSGTSGGPIVLKESGLVCGVAHGVSQTNNLAFSTNGSMSGIYYLLDRIKEKDF